MNARILGLLAVLALASGCIIHNDGTNYYGNPGDVTFSWTFNGASCQQTPGVASVVIDIPGQVLQPNTFACQTNGYPGITLTNFDSGTYSYTLTAYDAYNTPIYSASGTFYVDGPTSVPVNLAATQNATASALISWGFAAPTRNANNAPTCGDNQGGDISAVRLTVDGQASYYYCTDGVNGNAVPIDNLVAGQHTIEVAAVTPGQTTDGDYVFARATSTLNVTAGASTSQTYTLTWEVGGAVVDWAFFSHDGSTQYPDCASAGVDTMRINFYDTTSKTYLYPSPEGDYFTCPSTSNTVLYNALPPGQYQVTELADNSALGAAAPTVIYDYGTAPMVTIQAGAFAAIANAPAPPTPLYLR